MVDRILAQFMPASILMHTLYIVSVTCVCHKVSIIWYQIYGNDILKLVNLVR